MVQGLGLNRLGFRVKACGSGSWSTGLVYRA